MSDGTRRPRRRRTADRRGRSLREAQESRSAAGPGGSAPRIRTGPASRSATDHSALARGFRLSSELVAGVLVGAGIGWLIDRWLGTLPWGTFVFALAGLHRRGAQCDALGGCGARRGAGLHDRTSERLGRRGAARAARRRRGRDRPVMADPIHQFEINKIFTIGQDRRARDRVHQLVAVHGDRGRPDRRAAGRRDRPRAAWCRAGCSRSRSSPTSSSPPR